MARKKRDHKTEYARRKTKAKNLGYSNVSEYRRARASLSIPRTRRTPRRTVVERYQPETIPLWESKTGMPTMRRKAREWSKKHTRQKRSQYSADMSDQEVRDYYYAYVDRPAGQSRRKAARERRKRIGEYVRTYHGISEDEWKAGYELIPVG